MTIIAVQSSAQEAIATISESSVWKDVYNNELIVSAFSSLGLFLFPFYLNGSSFIEYRVRTTMQPDHNEVIGIDEVSSLLQ